MLFLKRFFVIGCISLAVCACEYFGIPSTDKPDDDSDVTNASKMSLIVIPEYYYNAIESFGMYSFYYSDSPLNDDYPFLPPASPSSGSLLKSPVCEVSFRIVPQITDIDFDAFEWRFVHAVSGVLDNASWVNIVDGPALDDLGHLSFSLSFNHPIPNEPDPDAFDMFALAVKSKRTGQEFMSDFFGVFSIDVYNYQIRNSYNSENVIELPYGGSVDLLDYVETYSPELSGSITFYDRISDYQHIGPSIYPDYEFWYAGTESGSSKVTISKNPAEAANISDDQLNQNLLIQFDADGHTIRVNEAYSASVAVGHTPRIYVRSSYDGKPIAECLLDINIKSAK